MSQVTIETPEFVSFLAGCQKLIDEHMAKSFPNYPANMLPTLSVEVGKRYIRIVKSDAAQRSAWGFIDTTNGDVLKAAGWKTPAKHARGNVFDASNGLKLIGPYGPAYLR